MTEQSISSSSHGFLGRFMPLIKMSALAVTIVGAIPTAITAYNAWQYKVPFTEVPHRLAQYEIWERNIDCKIDYKALATAEGMRVDVGACPKTRDISLKISSPDGAATYEWIAFNQLRKPGEQPPSSLIDLLIGVASAQDAGPTQLAQGALEVICQALVSKQQLVRVVREGDKCYRETMSPVRGTVDTREEVPCNTQCPGKG